MMFLILHLQQAQVFIRGHAAGEGNALAPFAGARGPAGRRLHTDNESGQHSGNDAVDTRLGSGRGSAGTSGVEETVQGMGGEVGGDV